MYIPDIFKKLRPYLGDRILPLQDLYLAGGEESRKFAERVASALYLDTITGIHPPPLGISSGKHPLGVVISGSKELHPFSLRDEDWFHIGIFGQTGRGKTTAMLHLLHVLREHNIPWLIFDWKRAGYRDLVSEYRDIHIFTIGRDIAPFHLNPLVPPEGVDTVSWYKQFIQCISHAYFLGHGCEMILQDVIANDPPTLIEVLKQLQTYPAKWRKLQWLQSTERAVKALCYGGISNVLNAKLFQPIHHWLDKSVIFELDALTESEAKFFVNIVMSQIYLYRKEHRHRGFQHVTVIEEAHNVLKKETANVEAKSVMDKIFREVREYGESIVFIDQMPSTVMDSAFANTATQITFSMKHSRDVEAAGRGMLLDSDEQLLLGKLPVGTAIVKLQNRWHAPFMVKLPHVTMRNSSVSDGMIIENYNGGQDTMENNKKSDIGSYSARNRVIPPGTGKPPQIPVISDSDKIGKRLLRSIAEQPLLGIAERYRRICVSSRSGNENKRKMLELGQIKEVNIKIGRARIKLLELTDKGKEKLAECGFNISKSLRHGGVEHLYWLRKSKKILQGRYKVFEEYPIGNGETVDLAIIGKKRKIAIEVETGKSDAVHNIRKALNAGFDVVSVAINEAVQKRIMSELTHFSESERQRIRAVRIQVDGNQ